MYAWSNSAMHHSFFPPRLQLVALQQNPNCLPAHLGHQLALNGLFGDQADRPTRPTFRRFTADHGDDALLLRAVENLLGSRSLFVVNGAAQAVADFRKAIALDSRNAEAWTWLGIALRKENKDAEARQAFGKALALDPSRVWVRQQLEKTPAK